MNFLFLGIFFRIFFKFISILNNKNELKNDKKLFIFCAGPTWMRRGTQGHVATPRGAYAAYTYIYYLHTLYIMGIQPSVYRKGFQML